MHTIIYTHTRARTHTHTYVRPYVYVHLTPVHACVGLCASPTNERAFLVCLPGGPLRGLSEGAGANGAAANGAGANGAAANGAGASGDASRTHGQNLGAHRSRRVVVESRFDLVDLRTALMVGIVERQLELQSRAMERHTGSRPSRQSTHE